jgi:ribosomal protein L37AE/L43A
MNHHLYVISREDLSQFGCPHCGCVEGVKYISYNTTFIWACESCRTDTAVVTSSINEINEIRVRNTNIHDIIGNHPYKRKFNDNMLIVGFSGMFLASFS